MICSLAYPGGGGHVGHVPPGVSGFNNNKKEGEKEGKRGRKKEKGRREGSDRDDLKKLHVGLKY